MCDAGKEWNLDSDHASAPAETGSAYLTMLAIDSLLSFVSAAEKLTDNALDGSAAAPDPVTGGNLDWGRGVQYPDMPCSRVWQVSLAEHTSRVQAHLPLAGPLLLRECPASECQTALEWLGGPWALSGTSLHPSRAGTVKDLVEQSTCVSLMEANWPTVLPALEKLLQRCSSEELVVQLLKVMVWGPLPGMGTRL